MTGVFFLDRNVLLMKEAYLVVLQMSVQIFISTHLEFEFLTDPGNRQDQPAAARVWWTFYPPRPQCRKTL